MPDKSKDAGAMSEFVTGQPRAWLRLEGLLILVVATTAYGVTDAPWLMFALLFFVPDVSFLGYLAGATTGAIIYNTVHSYAGPLVAALVLLSSNDPMSVPLIWFAHVGFDRMLGYGLKYPSAFQHTHLGRIGRGT